MFDSQSHPPREKKNPTKGKVGKKSYDNTKKFQTKWATKMPWASIMSQDGLINLMKCRVQSLIERKKKPWAINGIH